MAGMSHSIIQSYASSVEMVTSPDQWPLWKTKKPVVISLRHHHGRFEQHRYRYMVVTPGVKPGRGRRDGDGDGSGHNFNHEETKEMETEADIHNDDEDDNDDDLNFQNPTVPGSHICTSNDADFATEVMAWEDPFHTRNKLVRHTSSGFNDSIQIHFMSIDCSSANTHESSLSIPFPNLPHLNYIL
jgi:hypothetical protein